MTPTPNIATIIVKKQGMVDYITCWQAMRNFTDQRQTDTPDEIWLVEHPPVYTQGQNGKPEHILATHSIPLIHTDRGGQVTYHGPGQLVVYLLFDLKRSKITIREMVSFCENAVIAMLQSFGITGYAKKTAPGVYVNFLQQEAKICSIGLRVRRGCSYHGLALNVAMDLEPFSHINPCGFPCLCMAQIQDFVPSITMKAVEDRLTGFLCTDTGYNRQK